MSFSADPDSVTIAEFEHHMLVIRRKDIEIEIALIIAGGFAHERLPIPYSGRPMIQCGRPGIALRGKRFIDSFFPQCRAMVGLNHILQIFNSIDNEFLQAWILTESLTEIPFLDIIILRRKKLPPRAIRPITAI